ncbi:MAG: hypothetical protein ABIY56_08120, partial [Dokdonella sp.]
MVFICHLSTQTALRLAGGVAILLLGTVTCLAGNGSWSSNGPYGGDVAALISYEAGPATLWAVGGGRAFRSTSAGASWQRMVNGLPESSYISTMAAANNSPVLYAGGRSQLFRSGNGGDQWVALGTPATMTYVSHVAVRRNHPNTVAIAGYAGIWSSSNGGSSWIGSVLPEANYSGLAYSDDGSLYVSVRISDPSVFG